MSWFLMQSVEHTHLHAWLEPMRNAGVLSIPLYGSPSDCALAFNGNVCELHFEIEGWSKRGRQFFLNCLAQESLLSELAADAEAKIARLLDLVEADQSGARNRSPQELAEFGVSFFRGLRECHLSGFPIVLLETRHELWSGHVREMLALVLQRSGRSATELPRSFSLLTTPETPSSRVQERIARGRLLEIARRNSQLVRYLEQEDSPELTRLALDFPSFSKELQIHTERFGWIGYLYEGPSWSSNHFAREVATMLQSGTGSIDAAARHSELPQQLADEEQRLGLSDAEREALAVTRRWMYLKDARKDATYFAFAKTEATWTAVANVLQLPLSLVRMMLPEEVYSALSSGAAPSALELDGRRDGSLLAFASGAEELLIGKDAATRYGVIIEQEEVADQNVSVITGTCAVTGTASGRVRIVNTPESAREFQQGEVLVSVATDPSLEPAMVKAAAIVTDMGGITCHAAIISRELGIPCVVGTRIASHVLQAGESVVVEASAGRIVRHR